MLKPIPKKMLCDVCILKSPKKRGFYGDDMTLTTMLSNVRIEGKHKLKWSGGDTEPASGTVLYYDMVNSLPHGVTIKAGDIITYFSKNYRVESVQSVIGENKVHHIRAVLV